MTMIERVGYAVIEEMNSRSLLDGVDGDLHDEIADAIARAAIEAMREPTDLMGVALPDGYKPGSHSATQIYRAMIDAALNEGKT